MDPKFWLYSLTWHAQYWQALTAELLLSWDPQFSRVIAGTASPDRLMCFQIGVMYGNPEVTSGGNALKFYASVRLEVRRKATQESAKGDSIGIRVKAKVCPVPGALVSA